jgi:hypothetical protein
VIEIGIYKIGVEVVSSDMTFIPSFVKIRAAGSSVEADGDTPTHTHTHTHTAL